MKSSEKVLSAEQRDAAAEHVGLAYHLAMRTRNRWAGRLCLEDAAGAGLLALCESALLYEPSLGSLATYAKKSIIRSIFVESRRSGGAVSLPNRSMKRMPPLLRELASRALYPVRLDGEDAPEPTCSAPSEHLDREEEMDRVYLLLERLPERQRYIIRAHYLEGKTLQEVGGELGISKQVK